MLPILRMNLLGRAVLCAVLQTKFILRLSNAAQCVLGFFSRAQLLTSHKLSSGQREPIPMYDEVLDEAIVQVSAYPGWIVGVSYSQFYDGYRCWIVDPECNLLTDERIYEASHTAMLMARSFVEHHLHL